MTGLSDMRFEHPQQHSLANLEHAEQEVMAERLTLRRALFLADTLGAQGHPKVLRPIAQLKADARHSDVQKFVELVQRCYGRLRYFFRFEDLDEHRLNTFYRLDGPLYLKRGKGTSKLLVIFTTMYNNFYYSNAVVAALLSRLDCDLLFLRDTSKFNYLRGARGIADDFPGIGDRILDMARRNRIERIYLTGFSSSGYAALLTSLRIPCHGFLGFSHATDLRPESPLQPPIFFTPDVSAQVDPAWLQDLKPLLARADPAIPRALYYGDRSRQDASHAGNVEGQPGIRTICLPGVAHNTIEGVFARDGLLPLFARLISGRSDWPVPRTQYPGLPRPS